jgi:hypothetical protein
MEYSRASQRGGEITVRLPSYASGQSKSMIDIISVRRQDTNSPHGPIMIADLFIHDINVTTSFDWLTIGAAAAGTLFVAAIFILMVLAFQSRRRRR